jgi:hypothetical protein
MTKSLTFPTKLKTRWHHHYQAIPDVIIIIKPSQSGEQEYRSLSQQKIQSLHGLIGDKETKTTIPVYLYCKSVYTKTSR